MDSDHVGLRGTIELPGQGTAASFCKVAFSSRKVALAATNEANCF